MINNIIHIGIDYGSKLSGNTSIAYYIDCLKLLKCPKNHDADAFILEFVKRHEFQNPIYIDAPLSLPLAYFGVGDDYFYREVDRYLNAMSPMFIGGLTARAMRLKKILKNIGHELRETYPKAQAKRIGIIDKGYKKDRLQMHGLLDTVIQHAGLHVDRDVIKSWHDFDAVLALLASINQQYGKGYIYGNIKEGMIYL